MQPTKVFSCLSFVIILIALLVEGKFKRTVSRRNERKYPKPTIKMPNGPTNLRDQSHGHTRQINDNVHKLNSMSTNRLDKVIH